MPRSSDIVQIENLVLAAQGGDATAFESVLRAWLPVMRRHALRLTGDATAADDVVQEACLAIVGGLGCLDDPARAHGWMLRIVTNKAADWIRRRRRERRLSNSIRDREPRGGPNDRSGEAETGDRGAMIRVACLRLPLELRAVVSLYYGEGLSVAAVAAAVGVPTGTVKSRLHDARDQLKETVERSPP